MNYPTAGSIPARCTISWLIHVFLRDRHFAAHPESAASYLQSERGLLSLVFVKINAALHPAYRFFIKPARDDITGTQVFFDVKLQDLIENFVWRQCVLIFLIWFQLCAWRLFNRRSWNDFALPVDPARQLINHGLRNIADHGQPASHVAIERAISNSQFALVSGSQQQMTKLV